MPTKIDLLESNIKAYVQRNGSDPQSFNSFSCISANVPELQRKCFAFLLQNSLALVEQLLGMESCKGVVGRLKKTYKATIKRDGGGYDEYNCLKSVLQVEAKCREEARMWETGKNIPNDDKMLVCVEGEVKVLVFYPLQNATTRYEHDAKAQQEAKAIHGSTRNGSLTDEYAKAQGDKNKSKEVLSNARTEFLVWNQSVEQGITSQIAALMRENYPLECTSVLSAYFVSITNDKQMVDMNLNAMLNGLKFWPDLPELHLYESARETKYRLDYLKQRKALEGIKATNAQNDRNAKALKHYKNARLQTALKFVESWCDPDNEIVKVLLNQLRKEVKAINDKKKASCARDMARKKKRKEKIRKLVCTEGVFPLRELMDAGKSLFNQQVKS